MHQRVERLRQPDIPRMHDHELLGEAVRDRERIALRPRGDLRTVRPIGNDDGLRRVGSLSFDEASTHRVPECHHPVRLPSQEPVDSLKDPVDALALEILQESRDLGKHVTIGHDERDPESARGEIPGQPDDRGIGACHDDVRTVQPKSRIARGEEIAHVVTESAGEPAFREPRPPRPEDLDSPVTLALQKKAGPMSRRALLGTDQRHPRHHRDTMPVPLHQALAELRQQLTRGRGVRIEGPVEECDVHAFPYRSVRRDSSTPVTCTRSLVEKYQSIVRRRPSMKLTFGSHSRSFRPRLLSATRFSGPVGISG